MHVAVVSHPKGGVAKTTSVTGLAGALVEAGYRVLVVDLDPQGSLTLALGYSPQEVSVSIADLLQYRQPLANVILTTQVSGLDLIAASPRLRQLQYELRQQDGYTVLRSFFRPWSAQTRYDFLLVDTPPGQDWLTLNALVMADQVLMPTQPEYFAAYALRYLLQAIRWVRLRFHPALVYRAFLTMYHPRQRAHRWIRARLEATLGPGLCRTPIPVDAKVREAAIAGLPVTHYAPQSRAARAYRELAQEVFGHENPAYPRRAQETFGGPAGARARTVGGL